MNYNNPFGHPFSHQPPPFLPYPLPPYPYREPPSMFPQYFMPPSIPPSMPPMDPRMLQSPQNPMLVYQTNNYYAPSYDNPSAPQNVNPYFQRVLADSNPPKKPCDQLSRQPYPKALIPVSHPKGPPASRAAQIISIQSSEDNPVVEDQDYLPPEQIQNTVKKEKKQKKEEEKKKKKEEEEEKRKKEENYKLQLRSERSKKISLLSQLQRNIREAQQNSCRRSERIIKKRCKNQLQSSDSQQKQKNQMTDPLDIKRGKLIFKHKMSETQKQQLSMSKLRELRPQIMRGQLYQACMPVQLKQRDKDIFLKRVKTQLQARRFE